MGSHWWQKPRTSVESTRRPWCLPVAAPPPARGAEPGHRRGEQDEAGRLRRGRLQVAAEREGRVERGVASHDVGADPQPVRLEVLVPHPALEVRRERYAGRYDRTRRGEPEERAGR